MKAAIAILIAVACIYAFSSQRKNFEDNLNEFFELIDSEIADELRELRSLYDRDEQFLKAISFLESDKFVDLMDEIENVEEYEQLTSYLNEANVDLKQTVIKIYNFITEYNLEINELNTPDEPAETHGFIGYLNEVFALLPQDKIETTFNNKMENDLEFKSAVDRLTADEFDKMLNNLVSKRPVFRAVLSLQANGIPIIKIKNTFLSVFGIS